MSLLLAAVTVARVVIFSYGDLDVALTILEVTNRTQLLFATLLDCFTAVLVFIAGIPRGLETLSKRMANLTERPLALFGHIVALLTFSLAAFLLLDWFIVLLIILVQLATPWVAWWRRRLEKAAAAPAGVSDVERNELVAIAAEVKQLRRNMRVVERQVAMEARAASPDGDRLAGLGQRLSNLQNDLEGLLPRLAAEDARGAAIDAEADGRLAKFRLTVFVVGFLLGTVIVLQIFFIMLGPWTPRENVSVGAELLGGVSVVGERGDDFVIVDRGDLRIIKKADVTRREICSTDTAWSGTVLEFIGDRSPRCMTERQGRSN